MKQAKIDGYLRPNQDEKLGEWFARFLRVRDSLWDVIRECQQQVDPRLKLLSTYEQHQYFVLGFVSACLIIRLDRFLVEEFATDGFIQRKLNEGFPEYDIERKQYTELFNSFTDVRNGYRIWQAMKFASKERTKIKTLSSDPDVGLFVDNLWRYRSYLNPSKQGFLERGTQFVKHAVRRRGATIKQHTQFKFLEYSGRGIAEIATSSSKQITEEMLVRLKQVLRPGDFFVSRHKYALSNIFLPGYWPHAALYIGSPEEREQYQINLPPESLQRWTGEKRTLEALKDGVFFRELETTLSVDGVVVVRPNLTSQGIKEAIERVIVHEGKQYNFDFDFFRSDRIVCTEVVYRAFDGIEGIEMPLQKRAGRPTLSAEDLLDFALETDNFNVLAFYDAKFCPELSVNGRDIDELVRKSYKK